MAIEIIIITGEYHHDYEGSKEVAKKSTGRLITLKEAIELAKDNPKLFKKLEGNWFYLSEIGTDLDGWYKINYQKEILEPISSEEWPKTDYKFTASVHKGVGDKPLVLQVSSEDDQKNSNIARECWIPYFTINGGSHPTGHAPVVVVNLSH